MGAYCSARDRKTLSNLAKAGCDVFRINFSHGSIQDHALALRNIREVEQELESPLAILAFMVQSLT